MESKIITALTSRVNACFTGIWVQSAEGHEVAREITAVKDSPDQQWDVLAWDMANGCERIDSVGNLFNPNGDRNPDPTTCIRELASYPLVEERSTILVLHNLHKHLQSPELIQVVANAVLFGRSNRTFVVVVSPVVEIPVELQKLFVVIEHELPGRDELHDIAASLPQETKFEITDEALAAAAGLTRYEAEGAFSLSLVEHGELRPDVIWGVKEGMLKKGGLLTLYRGESSFKQLSGLESLKEFCVRSIKNSNGKAKPKGVLLVSPPGCGKSEFCKALGHEVGRPTIILDPGSLMGGIVGESESNTRRALQTIDAMAPCIVMIDEVEKALAGVKSSGQTDSGVTARMFGTLLTWLNDHESDVYVVMTSNNIADLPPEFSRAERFDGVFFVDMPGDETKRKIWDIYFEHYALDEAQSLPVDKEWTGAEIKACCRLASLQGITVIEAAENVVPVATSDPGRVAGLREFASGKYLSADYRGIYNRQHTQANTARALKAKQHRN